MLVWSYLAPHIWFGERSLEVLLEHISPDERVAVVTDASVKRSEFFSQLLRRVSSITQSVKVYDGVNSTPDASTIKECADFFSKTTPTWVVGVGGGAVLDTAKTARLLYEDPHFELNLEGGIIFERASPPKKTRSILVAIPTTTGSGAEATYGMVIKDPNPNDVCLVASHQALAHYAILDPAATASLPAEILASTAMDALGQSIEAYTSNLKNDFSDGHALVSIRLIFQWLRRAYTNPADTDARLRLQNAACLSGLAFGNAPGGLAHALADAFSPRFNYHHGRAVGIVLPYVMEFNSQNPGCRSIYAEIAHHLGIGGRESNKVRILIAKVRRLAQTVGLPASLSRAGINKSQWKSAIEEMVHRTLEDGILKNRRSFDSKDAAKILWCVWNGQHAHF